MVDTPIQKLITRSQFSREAGVSRQAVTKACRGVLAAAIVGNSIDVNHFAAIAYLQSKQPPTTKKPPVTVAPKPRVAKAKATRAKPARSKKIKPAAASSKGPVPSPPVPPPPAAMPGGPQVPSPEESQSLFSEDNNVAPFLNWTLRQLVDQFGTSTAFKGYVDAVDKMAAIRNKNLKSAALEKTLIPRALVQTHIFGAIENNNLRLLGDMPKTIARRARAMIKSGAALEDVETVIRELLGTHVKGVKETAQRVLRNA